MSAKFPISKVRAYQFSGPPPLVEPDHHPETGIRRLNLNENMHAPSPKAIKAMQTALQYPNFYPDNTWSALINLISERTGVHTDNIQLGNGSSELLLNIGRIAIEPGDEAIAPAPTFPMLGEGVIMAGGDMINVPVNANGCNDVPAMLAAMTSKTRIFYLCTPNNPTGGVLSEEELLRAINEVPDTCLLVIDEAYAEFAEHEGSADLLSLLKNRRGQWIITRTFSKAYALAGLRIGYCFTSDPELSRAMNQIRPSFVVSRIAMAAAEAAMRDQGYLSSSLDNLIAERNRLASELEKLGCKALPTGANFVTVRTPTRAGPLAKTLLEKGIMIQAMPWPDNNGSLRITIGSREDMDAVIEGLRPLLASAS